MLFTGGGTGGSLTPLLAVAQEVRRRGGNFECIFWISDGEVERAFVEGSQFSWRSMPAGKWRRYFDWKNIRDLFVIGYGFLVSFVLLLQDRPAIVLSAGSFVSVPIVWAAWLLHIPVAIHQQDVRIGLANRLMAPCARLITVTFERSVRGFPRSKRVVWIGNPVREEVLHGNKDSLYVQFSLHQEKPLVLVLGGSTGAEALNTLCVQALSRLVQFCNILHVTGQRAVPVGPTDGYVSVPFLSGALPDALAAADLVVTRAGLSTLTEVGSLGKASIVIPMPGTHQEENAEYLAGQQAALVLNQPSLTPESFADAVKRVLADHAMRETLQRNIRRTMRPDATARLLELIQPLIGGGS